MHQEFEKTEIKLKKFCDHSYPVARSQARRITENLYDFCEITIDFDEIIDVGQAFCHEIFVVFQNKHPDIQINTVNTSEIVHNMITRVLNTAKLSERSK